MDTKRFKMIDEEFQCLVCKKRVPVLSYTARDHCPYCLSSLHIDINPGDRLCKCMGILEPIDIEKIGEDLKIIYRCSKCGARRKNKVAKDDNYDLILEIMANK